LSDYLYYWTMYSSVQGFDVNPCCIRTYSEFSPANLT
jgi:hypothetical protein